MRTNYIYGLIDPRNQQTLLNVRYFGKAFNPHERYVNHLYTANDLNNKAPVYCWIRKLYSQGLKPNLLVVDCCDENEWQRFEKMYINFFKDNSKHELLNILDGGDAYPEQEQRKKRIAQYDLNGNLIKVYDYVRQVLFDGINHTVLINGLRKDSITYGYGFLWQYAADEVSEKIDITYDDIRKQKQFVVERKRLQQRKCKRKVVTFYSGTVNGVGMLKRFNTVKERKKKTLLQLDLNGVVINSYKSNVEAEKKLKLRHNTIKECLEGKRDSYHGHKFKIIEPPVQYCNHCVVTNIFNPVAAGSF